MIAFMSFVPVCVRGLMTETRERLSVIVGVHVITEAKC